MVALLGYMFVEPGTRIQLISSAVLAVVVLSVALVRSRRIAARRG